MSWKEQVKGEISRREQVDSEARLAENVAKAEAKKADADSRTEAAEASRPLVESIMEEWDSLDVYQILSDINSDVWEGFGELTTDEIEEDDVINKKVHTLEAVVREYSEERELVWKRKFGAYEIIEAEGTGYDGYWSRKKTKTGFHQSSDSSKLIGFKEKSRQSSVLRVTFWVPLKGQMGNLNIYDAQFGTELPKDFTIPSRYTGSKEDFPKATEVYFPKEDFDIDFISQFLNASLLSNSIHRSEHFTPKMIAEQEKLRDISRRIGEVTKD